MPSSRDIPCARTTPQTGFNRSFPFREVDNIEKVAPFGVDEGMSFGRQTHDLWGKPTSGGAN